MALPWVVELKKVLSDKEMGINQKASKALAGLQEAGLAYTSILKPQQVLIHPANRGGQMCNHHDVISKGLAICEVGWSLQKVGPSIAVELPTDSTKRAHIIDCNSKLAATSNGALCNPNGKERVCSLSTSHTCAFLRSLESGCKMETAKHISLEQLQAKNNDLHRMLTEGWEWTIVSSQVEDEVPDFCCFMQAAYNSSSICISCEHFCVCTLCFAEMVVSMLVAHHAIQGDHALVKPPNELEVAMTIAHLFQVQEKKDLAKAVAQAAAGMPPCRSYIRSIGDFVASYGGGESFQLLKYLDFMCG